MSEIQYPNPKLAILFFGIHYLQNYHHWMGWDCNIDHRKSIDNYQKYIFNFFKQKYDIDVFLSTHDSDILRDLENLYHPKQIIISQLDNNKTAIKQRRIRILEGIYAIEKYDIDKKYDLCLLTRFDLEFIYNFERLNIMHDHINVSYKTGCGSDKSLLDDNFYIIDRRLLTKFKECIYNLPENIWLHNIHHYNKEMAFNPMIDGFYYSHESPLYRFVR